MLKKHDLEQRTWSVLTQAMKLTLKQGQTLSLCRLQSCIATKFDLVMGTFKQISGEKMGNIVVESDKVMNRERLESGKETMCCRLK
jgi:hypothetical protein